MRRLEAWLFAPGSDVRLAALRIGLCSVLAGRLATGSYVELAEQPSELFRPISFMQLLDSMPPRGAVVAVQVAGVLAAVLAALGVRSRLSLPLAWACGIFLNGMLTSTGKVVHNDVVLLLCLVPLLAASAGDAWSLDARRAGPRDAPRFSARYGWPVRTAMVVVAGSYFFAGLAKLVNSGPAWVTSDNMRWILYASGDSGVGLFIADRPWLAHLTAAGILLLELTFPLVLWRARLAWIYVPGALAFHAGTWLTLGLDYSAQAATVLVVLINWPAVLERVRSRASPLKRVQPGT